MRDERITVETFEGEVRVNFAGGYDSNSDEDAIILTFKDARILLGALANALGADPIGKSPGNADDLPSVEHLNAMAAKFR